MMKKLFQTVYAVRTVVLLVTMSFAPFLGLAQVQQNVVLQAANEDQWAGLTANCSTTGGYVSIASTISYPNFGPGIELAKFSGSGNITPPFMLYTAPTTANRVFEARDIQKAPAVTAANLPAGYFIVGISRPTTGSGATMLYLRTDCAGNVLWAKLHNNPNSQNEEGVSCVALTNGDSYYVGKIAASAGSVMYVARFNASGGLTWGNQYQCYACNATASCSIVPREATLEVTSGTGIVQAAATQGIAITGESTTGTPNIGGMHAFVSVINSVGTEVWRNSYYLSAPYLSTGGYDIVQNLGQGNKLTIAGRADQTITGSTNTQSKIYVFQVTPNQSTVAGTSNLVWADVISPTNVNLSTTYARAIEISNLNPQNYLLAGVDFNASTNGSSFFMEISGSGTCTAPVNVVWARSYPSSMAHPMASESITKTNNGYFVTSHAMGNSPTAAVYDMFEIFTDLNGNTPSCPISNPTYSVLAYCNYYPLAKCKSTDNAWTTPIVLANAVTPTENPCPVPCGVTTTFTDSADCASIYFTSSTTGCTGTLTYNWSFGDGSTANTANPSHTYTATGTYNVCLTVTCTLASGATCTAVYCKAVVVSNVGANTTFTYTVNSNAKTVSFSGVVTTGCSGTKTYTWDFGDGTSSTATTPPIKTYTNPGTYTICVKTACTVNGQTCCTYTCKTVIIPAPCPTFYPTFTVLTPSSGLGATFTPTAGTTGYSYSWTFTDANNTVVNTSSLRNPTIIFPSTGTYTACMTVKYGSGNGAMCEKSMCKQFVISNNSGCTLNANFKYTVNTLQPGTFNFVSTSTGTNIATTYTWDFVFGTTSYLTNPSVVFVDDTLPPYVMLTVNNGACTSKVSMKINVESLETSSVNCATGLRVISPSNEAAGSENAEQLERENGEIMSNEVQFFPNPTDNVLHIVSPIGFSQGTNILVTNLMGNLMYEKLVGGEINSEEIDMSHFAAGIYLISIRNTDGTILTKKVVKE